MTFSKIAVLQGFLWGTILTSFPAYASAPPSRQTADELLWAQIGEAASADLTSAKAESLLQSYLKQYPQAPLAMQARYSLAEREFLLGHYEKAAVGFERFLEDQHPIALTDTAGYRLAECYYNLKAFNSAETAWQRMISRGRDSALIPQAMAQLAALRMRAGAWGEADEMMRQLDSRYPSALKDPEVRQNYGLIDFQLGRFQEAIKHLEGLPNSKASYYRGLSLFALTLYEDAAASLQQVDRVSSNPYVPSAAFLRGESFFQRKSFTLAVNEFKDFIRAYPQSPLRAHARLRLAAAHLLVKEPADAITEAGLLLKDTQAKDLFGFASFIKGCALIDERDYSAAAVALNEALEESLPPEWAAAAWVRKAWVLRLLNQQKASLQAIKTVQEKYASTPSGALADYLEGVSLFQSEQWAEAGTRFESALLSHPYSVLSEAELALMAVANNRAGRQDQLVTSAHAALKILSNNYASSSPYWRGQSFFFIGQAYFQLKKYRQALPFFTRVTTDFGDHPLAPRARLLKAWCLLETRKPDKAREELAGLLEAKTGDKLLSPYAVFLQAASFFNSKDYDRAITEFDGFLKTYPRHDLAAEARYLIGTAYFQKKVFGSAIEAWSLLVKEWPQHPLARTSSLQIGDLYFRAGQFGPAADFFRDFQMRYPKDPQFGEEAVWKEIQAYFNGKNDEAAIQAYPRYIEQYPQGENIETARNQLEMVYFRRGADGDPVKLEEFLARYPKSPFAPAARFKLGEMALDQKKWQRAALEMTSFIRDWPVDPQAPAALYHLGQAYENLGDIDKALEQYQLILRQYSGQSEAVDAAFRLGTLHFQKERYQEAADAFVFAAGKKLSDPVRANLSFNLAVCYENLGRLEEAGEAYLTYARYTQDAEPAREAQISAALLFKKSQNHSRAVRVLKKLVDDKGLPSEMRLQAVSLLGECLEASGRRGRAINALEGLVGLEPAASDTRLAGLAQLAYLYEQEKQFPKAISVYEKIAISQGKSEWVEAARERILALTQSTQTTP